MSEDKAISEGKQLISDPSDLRKYRTELPNLYDDAGLDVYEMRLLVHYKRVGKCTESIETTARKCRMAVGKASQARMSLSDKGWIRLTKVPMDKSRYRYIVQVVDRWIENFARYSGLSKDDIQRQLANVSTDFPSGSPSPHEGSPSPHEGKKELIKNLNTLSTADFQKMTVEEAYKLQTLRLYRDATGYFPGQAAWEYVHLTILKHGLTVEKIRTASQEWAIRGYKPANVKGILEWALNGIPQTQPKGQKSNGNSRTGNQQHAGSKSPKPSGEKQPTDADRAAAERVKARKQQREQQAGVR